MNTVFSNSLIYVEIKYSFASASQNSMKRNSFRNILFTEGELLTLIMFD